jgi:hypothetical protein
MMSERILLGTIEKTMILTKGLKEKTKTELRSIPPLPITMRKMNRRNVATGVVFVVAKKATTQVHGR